MLGRLRSLLWAAALGVTAAIAFWSFLRWGPSQETPSASDAAQMAAKESGEAKPIDTPAPSGSPAPPADAARQVDLTELRRLCGRPWVAEFGPECLAALERRYGNTVPDRRWEKWVFKWRPVMLGQPVTWAEVFARPADDLAAVAEAVERPECLVPEGRFRIDLRRKCAADEMARLAILRRECVVSLRRYERPKNRQARWDIEQREVDRAEDQPEYYRRMARRSERWFGGMWRLAKCRALPEGALAAIGPFTAEHHGRDLDPRLLRMMEAAARLGSDWALSSVLRFEPTFRGKALMLPVDDAGIEDVRASRPVLAELLRMRRAEGAERTKHAIAAYMLGTSLGVAVHPEGVERITGPPDATWPAAAPKAARWLVEQGWTLIVDDGELRRFERPEDVAEHQPWWDYWLERRMFVATNAPAENP